MCSDDILSRLLQLKALSYVQITTEGQLRILGAHDLDTGQYRCEARNEAGSDSALIQLEVGGTFVKFKL